MRSHDVDDEVFGARRMASDPRDRPRRRLVRRLPTSPNLRE